MGHDVHFLERLSRVEAEDESLALSLYQDPELVRTILSLAQLPDGAERVALALQEDPEGPHVVVARDGGFVTCLGPGMSTGPVPILTRHQLEGMRVRAERVRAALYLAESFVDTKTREGRPISGRLFHVGPAGTVADYELATAFLALNPLELLISLAELYQSLQEAYAAARRLVKLRKITRSVDIELLHKLYKVLWGVGHTLVVVASDPQLYKNCPEQVLENFYPVWMGIRLRSTPIVYRALWAASRFAPLCFKLQRHILEEAVSPDPLDCATFAMAAAGCRHSKLRDEAVRLLERARRTPVEGELWRIYREEVLGACLRSLDKNLDLEGMMQGLRRMMEEQLASQGMEGEVTDKLLRWTLVTHERPFDAFATEQARAYLPLVANFDGSDFFLPSVNDEMLAEMKITPLETMLNVLREDVPNHVPGPLTRAATPGRNDPCSCGSGKKYKSCCADPRSQTKRGVSAKTPKASKRRTRVR